MKRLFASVATISLILTAGAVEIDGVVATVGSQRILRNEVIQELRRQGLNEKDNFVEARNALIERCLIIKAAEASKMSMQDWVVENRIREIIDSSFGGDRNKLVAALSQQKLSYADWSKKVKENLIVDAMRWNMIDKNISPSPAEMREEFKSHPEKYRYTDKVYVSVITVKPGETRPESFNDALAKKYDSVDPKEVFNPQIQEVIAKLKKGETSSWVEMDGWFIMIRKTDESASHSKTFVEAYDEIEANVKSSQAIKLYREWMNRLKAETYIKIY